MLTREHTVCYILCGIKSINLKAKKSITQKGNAHLDLGQFDEAKECYESLRTLGENSAANKYLKKLHEAQERENIGLS